MTDQVARDEQGDCVEPADLHGEYLRQRSLNRKLTNWALRAGIAAIVGLGIGAFGYLMRATPEQVAVDPAGRGNPVTFVKTNNKQNR